MSTRKIAPPLKVHEFDEQDDPYTSYCLATGCGRVRTDEVHQVLPQVDLTEAQRFVLALHAKLELQEPLMLGQFIAQEASDHWFVNSRDTEYFELVLLPDGGLVNITPMIDPRGNGPDVVPVLVATIEWLMEQLREDRTNA